MARTVVRMGIPSRFTTNPNVAQSQEFIPGASIPAATLSNPNSTSQQSSGTPQSLYIPQSKLPTRSITTPNGNVVVRYSIIQGAGGSVASLRPEAIVKNQIFTQPYTVKTNGFTNTGTNTFDYAILNNQLVPQVTAQTGNITYNNTVVGNVSNGKITPTKNIVTQNVTNAGINLGSIEYTPTVTNNNTLGLQYTNFKGAVVERTVPEYYSDPFTGMSYKVGFTYGSNPTTYNPTTNQVNLTFPSMSSMFGSSPLFINSKTSTVSVNGTPTKVFYNINTSPSAQTTYFTGFDVAGASTKSLNIGQTGGATTQYSIINGNIQGVNASAPISMAGISSKAILTYNAAGQYSVVNNGSSTEYLGGGINVKGVFSLQTANGQQIEVFNPLSYSFANGATTNTLITASAANTILATDLLKAQGISASNISQIFGQQPQSITETINSKTGQLSILGTPYIAAKSFSFNSTGGVTGYANYNASGNVVGGADFLNPKSVILVTSPLSAGIVSKNSITLLGAQLPQNYLVNINSAQQLANQNSVQAQNSQNFLNIEIAVFSALNHQAPSLTQQLLKYYNPILGAYNAGQTYALGSANLTGVKELNFLYPETQLITTGKLNLNSNQVSGLEQFGSSLIQGEALVFIAASPIAAGIGATINIGTSQALSYATTGNPLGISATVNAGLTGAVSGSILGTLAPEGSSVAGYVVKQTVNIAKYNALFGGAVSAVYGLVQPSAFSSTALYQPTTISGQNKVLTQSAKSQRSQLQSSQGVLPYIFNTFTNPSYLSFIGKGVLQGAQYGTAYAGEFGLGNMFVNRVIEALPSSVASAVSKPYIAKPLFSAIYGSSTFGIGLALGQPLRVAAIEGGVAAALPFAYGLGSNVQTNIDLQRGKGFLLDTTETTIGKEGEPTLVYSGTDTNLGTVRIVGDVTENPEPVETLRSQLVGKEMTTAHSTTSLQLKTFGENTGERITLVGAQASAASSRYNLDLRNFYQAPANLEGETTSYGGYIGVGESENGVKIVSQRPSILLFRNTVIESFAQLQGESTTEFISRINTEGAGKTGIAQENTIGMSTERQVVTPSAFEGNFGSYPGTMIESEGKLGTAYIEQKLPVIGDIPLVGKLTSTYTAVDIYGAKIVGTGTATGTPNVLDVGAENIELESSQGKRLITSPGNSTGIYLSGLDPIIQTSQNMTSGVIPSLGIQGAYSNRSSISGRETSAPIFPQTSSNPYTILKSNGSGSLSKSINNTNSISSRPIGRPSSRSVINNRPLNSGQSPLTSVPNFTNNFLVNPFRLKISRNPTKQKAFVPSNKRFGYVSDITHAILHITGNATQIGLSRPIPKKRGKKR